MSKPAKTEQGKAFDEFINHLMSNKGTCCFAPAKRYCAEGKRLKALYSRECKGAYYDFRSNRKR